MPSSADHGARVARVVVVGIAHRLEAPLAGGRQRLACELLAPRTSITSGSACFLISAAGVPCSSIRPWSMMISSSHRRSASSCNAWRAAASCRPDAGRAAVPRSCAAPAGRARWSVHPAPPVRRSLTSARAIVRRRFMPPESVAMRASARSDRSTNASSSRMRVSSVAACWNAEVAAVDAQVFATVKSGSRLSACARRGARAHLAPRLRDSASQQASSPPLTGDCRAAAATWWFCPPRLARAGQSSARPIRSDHSAHDFTAVVMLEQSCDFDDGGDGCLLYRVTCVNGISCVANGVRSFARGIFYFGQCIFDHSMLLKKRGLSLMVHDRAGGQ